MLHERLRICSHDVVEVLRERGGWKVWLDPTDDCLLKFDDPKANEYATRAQTGGVKVELRGPV